MGVGVTAENVLKYVNVKVGTGIFGRIVSGAAAVRGHWNASAVRVMCICRLF